MENCRGGLHIRPRGVEDAAPYKPKGRTVGYADVRIAAFPQEPVCLTREGRACSPPTVQSQLKQEQKPSIMSTTSKSKTMIEGPLAKQILLVSLPLALSNLLQILFNMSDVAVVGRFAGSTALGSVGSTATFVTLFTGFLIGLSNGVNVLVARFYGAGHPKDVSKTVHSALLVSLAAGVLLLFVGLFGSPALLELLNTKEDLLPGAILYLRVYFLGMPALALYNFGNAVFSAIGETKKPLAYLSFAGVLNILLNLFFVIVCKLDVAGVALAYSFGLGAVLGGGLLVFGRQFLALFTTESAVIDAGMKRIMVMGWAYCTSAFMDCTIAASRGLGKTVGPTVIVILGSCVFRVAWVYTIFAHFHTIPALYLLYPCSWALTAAAEIVYFVFSYRHAALRLQERDALAQL